MTGSNSSNEALAGRVAVVSGASRGLGRAIAVELAQRGAEVVAVARDGDRLAGFVAELEGAGLRASAERCDLTDAAAVAQLASRLGARFDRVDILVNNVGAPAPRTLGETDTAAWDEAIAVNLSAAYYLSHALWPQLVASGSAYLFTISGTAGLRGGGSPAYGAAKFGLTGLVRALAQTGREHGVRSTLLFPGSMDTGWRGSAIGALPANETMDPAEVARTVAYLAATPPEYVVNEAVLNPLDAPWQ